MVSFPLRNQKPVDKLIIHAKVLLGLYFRGETKKLISDTYNPQSSNKK